MVISERDALGPRRAIEKRLDKFDVDHMSYTFLILDKEGAFEALDKLGDVIEADSKCIVYQNFNDNPVAMMVSYKRYAELLSIEDAYNELRQAHP